MPPHAKPLMPLNRLLLLLSAGEKDLLLRVYNAVPEGPRRSSSGFLDITSSSQGLVLFVYMHLGVRPWKLSRRPDQIINANLIVIKLNFQNKASLLSQLLGCCRRYAFRLSNILTLQPSISPPPGLT